MFIRVNISKCLSLSPRSKLMFSMIKTAFLFLIFAAPVLSQSPTRDEKIQNIFDLRSRMTALEKEVLQPDSRDVSVAKRLGLEAIRLLPREKYDRVIAINGGGAY